MKNFDITRKNLKSLGWKREDRTSNGIVKEMWIPPWDGIGMRPLPMFISHPYSYRRGN